jgi:two-component system phosphate regulon sensor histidine kinase PhoR
MNDSRYKISLYIIVVVIFSTICIQVYWNFKNYQIVKQQLINEVQISLDKAVDDYYTALAEKTTLGISLDGDHQKNAFDDNSELTKILKQIDENSHEFKNLDSISKNEIEGITIVRGIKADSMLNHFNAENKPISKDSFKQKIDLLKIENDSIDFSNIKMLTSKIVISINNDTLKLNEVDSLLKNEFTRKKINVSYQLNYINSKLKPSPTKQYLDSIHKNKDVLSTTSKSSFLPKNSTLKIEFTNETWAVLKRILGGILISTLLVLAVISCLFYLLNIIKHQKQLAEVKNDLISNITHEFKTPIATIGVALESINDFNVIDDKEKTKRYLKMSSEQLSKLNIMVEKLLETATLDGDSLQLKKDDCDIVELLTSLIKKHQLHNTSKEIHFVTPLKKASIKIDVFHFENAINNVLDNAVKYGGNLIKVTLKQEANLYSILISDNGKELTKAHKDKIFEKFYRVPKGNTHNIKGFGIGLYYTKKIIEKHGGTINLELQSLTTFKISIPNV